MNVFGNFFKLRINLNYELENSIGFTKRFYMPPKKKNTAVAASGNDAAASIKTSDLAIFVNKTGNICLNIFAKPGSKECTSIVDIQSDAINVRINAPPVDGEANKELIKYISKVLNMKTSEIELDKGNKNRNKTLILSNCQLTQEQILNVFRNECDTK